MEKIWTQVAHNAAHFGASTGSWTVPSSTRWWTTIGGHTCIVMFYIGAGSHTISAAATSLFIEIPAPAPALASLTIANNPFTYYMAGAAGTGYIEMQNAAVVTPGARMRLLRDPAGTPFPAVSSGVGYFWGQIAYPF